MAISKQVILLAIAGSIVLIFNLTGISYFHLPTIPSLRSRERGLEAQPLLNGADDDEDQHNRRTSLPSKGKPWPSLPSLLPWLPRPKLPPHSCEAYFGNGYTDRIDIFSHKASSSPIKPRASRVSQDNRDKPALHCFYSKTLRTSICEGRKIVMHPGRIHMSIGGEVLDSVIGRTDAEELPSFSPGAFEIAVPSDRLDGTADWVIAGKLLDAVLPQGQIHDHKLRSLFNSIRTVSSDDISCSQEVTESTLLVIRFEYANLYHTATDWYSSYIASRVLDLPHFPNVVFVDGHCQSPMDDGWEALFSDVKYAKNFTTSVCFDHVIFTPLGYDTALFKGLNSGIPCKGCPASELKQAEDNTKTARLREFGELFKAAFGVLKARTSSDIKILFVRRESYLAHPRHSGKPEIRLRNEQELLNAMESWARVQSQKHNKKRRNVQIINGTLAHMKMKEQVQAVHDASIIIGVHGAGLTHILFARPGTVILELLSPLFLWPHYSYISQWMGLEYHSITMAGTEANCAQVLDHLSTILDSLL